MRTWFLLIIASWRRRIETGTGVEGRRGSLQTHDWKAEELFLEPSFVSCVALHKLLSLSGLCFSSVSGDECQTSQSHAKGQMRC